MRKVERSHRAGARVLEAGILLALPILFHYLLPVKMIIARPYSYLGAAVMLLGLALATWASTLFRKAGTGFQLRGGGTALVTSGPYRFSRNPMYLGMLIWLLGLAILLGSLSVFLFPVLFFLLANFLVIPLEEKGLAETLGTRFADYKRRVRRWL